MEVPAEAYYGAQTARAVANFPISGLKPHPALVWGTLVIKKCAARANMATGRLPGEIGAAIVQAADEALAGRFDGDFVVDPFQAGAGTSHNMNVNEVLANRAAEILGGAARRLRQGPSQRPCQHGPVDQRRLPDRHAAGRPAHGLRSHARNWRGWSRPSAERGGIRPDPQVGAHPSAGCGADQARPGVRGLCRGDRTKTWPDVGAVPPFALRTGDRRDRGRDRPECRGALHRAGGGRDRPGNRLSGLRGGEPDRDDPEHGPLRGPQFGPQRDWPSTSSGSPTICASSHRAPGPASTRSTSRRCSPARRSCRAR